MTRNETKRAERAARTFAEDPESVMRSFIATAKTFPLFPRDILAKMVFEGWTAGECALEHAARSTVESYEPFSISRSTLRRYLGQGRRLASAGRGDKCDAPAGSLQH